MGWEVKRASFRFKSRKVPESFGETAGALTRDPCADIFPLDDTSQIMGFEEIKNDDGHPVLLAEGEGGRIEYFQLLLQRFLIRHLRIPSGVFVLLGVLVVNTIHFGRLQNHFSPNFIRS